MELRRLLNQFEQQNVIQQATIAQLWGISKAGAMKLDVLRNTWGYCWRRPIATRFVWSALPLDEQTVLFHVLNNAQHGNVNYEWLLQRTSLDSDALRRVLDHLESLLLLQINSSDNACGYIPCLFLKPSPIAEHLTQFAMLNYMKMFDATGTF